MQSLHRFHGSEWLASARNLPKLQEQDIRLFRISLGHWQCSLGGNCGVVFVLGVGDRDHREKISC